MTKTQAVLNWLETGASISSMEAFREFGATRLSAIIFELRRKGHDIETIRAEGRDRYGHTVRFARYRLKK